MKKFIQEFKAFIMRGNVLDMAVGVIIATAFGAITNSLVGNIFMPFISWIFGTRDMSALNIVVRPELTNEYGKVIQEGITLGFGTFLATVIDFVLVALVVFTVVKSFNKAREIAERNRKAAAEEAAPAGPTTEELLSQILEELKKKG